MYINGRWYTETEVKAYVDKLIDENAALKEENSVILHETDRLIKEKGKLIKENEELKKLRDIFAKVDIGKATPKDYLDLLNEWAEMKELLKAAVEDIVWLNEHTVDGEGQCLIETATDMETCLACPLNVNNSHICGWKHQVEALALIGDERNEL